MSKQPNKQFFGLRCVAGDFNSVDRTIQEGERGVQEFIEQFPALEDRARALGSLDRALGNAANQLAIAAKTADVHIEQAESESDDPDQGRTSAVSVLSKIAMAARLERNSR